MTDGRLFIEQDSARTGELSRNGETVIQEGRYARGAGTNGSACQGARPTIQLKVADPELLEIPVASYDLM